MNHIRLFQITKYGIQEKRPKAGRAGSGPIDLKSIHIEQTLKIRAVIESESTDETNPPIIVGILGIDEDNCPVVVEQKNRPDSSLYDSGVRPLDWVVNHKIEFGSMARESLGEKCVGPINWTVPRLICLADSFSHADIQLARLLNRNIDLVRVFQVEGDFWVFQLVESGRAE